MSAPVDVLAVLDRAFGAAHEHYDHLKSEAAEPALGPAYQRACRYMAEHREARAAVAELIEAAERANGDHTAPHDCYATGPMTGDPIRDLVACPGCELSAALARVKGGAA